MTDSWKLNDVPEDLVDIGAARLWGDGYQTIGLPSYDEAKINPHSPAWGDLTQHIEDVQMVTREVLSSVLPVYRKDLLLLAASGARPGEERMADSLRGMSEHPGPDRWVTIDD